MLALVCMTMKIQLELRLLREGKNIGGYSPWWGNETIGHLRAFPKLARRPNVNLSDLVNTLPGYDNFTLTTESGRKSDPKNSNRKILSDATNKTLRAAGKSSGTGTEKGSEAGTEGGKGTRAGKVAGTVSRNSGVIEHNTTATGSPSNRKIPKGIFAKLRIYDGENIIDTDAIYSPKKRKVVSEGTKNALAVNASIAQGDANKETAKARTPPKVIILKHSNATQGSKRSVVPLPKIGQRSPQSLAQKAKASVSRGVSHDVDEHEMSLTKEEIAQIKEELTQENEMQKVYNEERFGPVLRNTTILLVQVSMF